MTRVQLLRTLSQTGFIFQWGHRTYSWYPLRLIGGLLVRRWARERARELVQERKVRNDRYD